MSPKQKFEKEQIVEVALELVKNEGFASVTARRIAKELNSSTAPVYTYFVNIDEIKREILKKIKEIMNKYVEVEYTDDLFLNVGVGILAFVRDYKRVYYETFLGHSKYLLTLNELNDKHFAQMKKSKHITILGDELLKEMLKKMSTYTHGLAAMICSDLIQDTSTEYFIKNLADMGGDVICSTLLKHGKLEEYKRSISNGTY